MPLTTTRLSRSSLSADTPNAQFVRLRFKTLEIPTVKDGVVIGRSAQVNPETMSRILELASSDRFQSLQIEDDVVGSIFVRDAVLRKIDADAIKQFVVEQIKPVMAATEAISLHLEIEIVMEQAF